MKTSSFYLEYKRGENNYKLKENMIAIIKFSANCIAQTTGSGTISYSQLMWLCMYVERIERNTLWWNSNIPKLKTFCFSSFLPELPSPRYCCGGIRELPDYLHVCHFNNSFIILLYVPYIFTQRSCVMCIHYH